jgi:hypothetical protein
VPAVKFAPIEAYTVVYDMTGAQNGTLTQHSRRYGLEQSHINDLALPNGGRNRTQVVATGDRIISYDPNTRRAGATANPAYATFVAAASGKSDADLPKALLQSVGFIPTGRMQNIAGETCMVWENRTLQGTRCVTNDGVLLQARLNRPNAMLTQTARAVRRGDAGPNEAYVVPAGVTVTEVKSMAELPGFGG